MSSVIDYAIPTQAYELIRDRIGAILAVEVAEQVVLGGDYEMEATVWVERSRPFDLTELPAINVSLATGRYDNKHQGDARGTYRYNIDIYMRSKATNDQLGDVLSAFKVQKLIGICRHILEHTAYKYLLFTPPFIQRTMCEEINISQMDAGDMITRGMGRLSFTVVAGETTTLMDSVTFNAHWTTVKLALTEKGYQYKIELE